MATILAAQTISIYTVPAGMSTILKNIWLNNGESTTNPIQLHLHPAAPGPEIYVFSVALTPSESRELNTWVVLEQGDQLLGTSLGGTFRVWASGAELPG